MVLVKVIKAGGSNDYKRCSRRGHGRSTETAETMSDKSADVHTATMNALQIIDEGVDWENVTEDLTWGDEDDHR